LRTNRSFEPDSAEPVWGGRLELLSLLPVSLDIVFERFTDKARRVLVLAQEEARLLNHSFIGTEHLLLGLIHEGEGIGAKALESLGVDLEATRERVRETISTPLETDTGSPPFTPRATEVLELALREALKLGHSYIGTEHLLLGLCREGKGVAIQVLQSFGVYPAQVRQEVTELLSGYQEGIGFSVQRASESSFSASDPRGPRCPGCKAHLVEKLHYRTVTIPPTTQGLPPISVEVVFCGQCGVSLGMFKAGQSTEDGFDIET
jgi:Clp amino terminal domain, pathogenicity island component